MNEPTRNADDAFYGAMAEIGRAIGRPDWAQTMWRLAMEEIGKETAEETGGEPRFARAFLDGDWGMAFALDVNAHLPQGIMPATLDEGQMRGAVLAAIAKWQSWRLEPKDYRDLGIPEPMRYLDGMVLSAGYYDEEEEDEEIAI